MRASLFITCYNDTLYPETGRAVVTLLDRLGVEVDFRPAQTCCGQMHANTGFRSEAYSQAKRFVRLYRDAETVVIPSSSCVAMIRDQYPGLFDELGNEDLRKDFRDLLPRVYELSEFLIDVAGITDVGASFPHAVALHQTCHSMRLLGVGDRPRRLLEAVDGVRLVDLQHPDACCGFGGTFAVKNADTSVAMGTDKVDDIVSTGAEVLTAGDTSCLMHLGGLLSRRRSPIRVMHFAEILAGPGSAA